MKIYRAVLYGLLGLCSGLSPVRGQDTKKIAKEHLYVQTSDLHGYVGRLVHIDSTFVVIDTAQGAEFAIERSRIRYMRKVSADFVRRYRISLLEVPMSANYFINASAYGPSPGQLCYQSSWFILHQVAYGFTDYFSIRAGGAIAFSDLTFPIFIAPKLRVPLKTDILTLGMEGYLGGGISSEDLGGVSFSGWQGLLTWGNRHTHLTAGWGTFSKGNRWMNGSIAYLAGSLRLNIRWGLITENFISTAYRGTNAHFLGLRHYGRNVSFDLSLLYVVEKNSDFGNPIAILPWLGVGIYMY